MLKIDTHQHFWRYRPEDYPWIGPGMEGLARDQLPGDVEVHLQASGLQAAIAVQARAQTDETDALLALAAQFPWVRGVVGWMDLQSPVADQKQRLDDWQTRVPDTCRLAGFRHQLQDEADPAAWVSTPGFGASMQQLQALGLVYDILLFDTQMDATFEAWARHDRHWLVLDHLGKPALRHWGSDPLRGQKWLTALRRYATLPHCACKLSGLLTETARLGRSRPGDRLDPGDRTRLRACLDQALDAFGPQRLLFGSDWPVASLVADFRLVLDWVEDWAQERLPREQQEGLWGGNALRIYGLPSVVEGGLPAVMPGARHDSISSSPV